MFSTMSQPAAYYMCAQSELDRRELEAGARATNGLRPRRLGCECNEAKHRLCLATAERFLRHSAYTNARICSNLFINARHLCEDTEHRHATLRIGRRLLVPVGLDLQSSEMRSQVVAFLPRSPPWPVYAKGWRASAASSRHTHHTGKTTASRIDNTSTLVPGGWMWRSFLDGILILL